MSDKSFDVLVIGAGMAGCTVAARAAAAGLEVCMVDVSDDVGGSARYAGYVWTMPDHDAMTEQNPGGDETLRRTLVDGFADGVEWLRSVGADVGPSQPILSYGQGHRFDTNHFVDLCRKIVTGAGGQVLLGTEPEDLIVDDGVVQGVVVRTRGQSAREIHSTATVLATGGFQADAEHRARHLHPNARDVELRSNPNSRGGGHRLAAQAGAAFGKTGAGFYGHLIPSEIALTDADFVELALYYSEHALLFNLQNKRFTDESLADHLTTMELLEQPQARGLLIGDARVYRDWMTTAYVEGAVAPDKFAAASKRGGRTGMADSLEELAYLPEEWGYDGAAIAAEIDAYNTVVRSGGAVPDRRRDRLPLDEPPYYVIETVPAVTFPFYGIRIDEHARVLDDTGQPILGLLAAGSDTGGVWYRSYGGGLATALVFGLAAAATAIAAHSS
ncbi:FAD-dependent oxidoreductase [Gordonia sp. OPL2]|uniref:FAD-dependent oxidoreductase n=1 Tax=Gordonia sp. OPL2 TaxID=2486274 RepID=UPI00165617E0|nr:FAD-dependent oxidoreductase [Gordonia sp. OPL2]ROZ99136.1 FAD-binding protein [Gordonia sp. OPL2]